MPISIDLFYVALHYANTFTVVHFINIVLSPIRSFYSSNFLRKFFISQYGLAYSLVIVKHFFL
jgi:hypothetical protein